MKTILLSLDAVSTTQDLSLPGIGRLIFSFVTLLVALWLIVWVLKKLSKSKLGFFNHESNIKVVEKKSLSPKTNIYVVEFEGRKVLIAESNQHIKMSHEFFEKDSSQSQ